MIVKLLSFKPNKDGSVTLYLDKGADLHTLIDMSGQNIIITDTIALTPVGEAIFNPLYERGKSLINDAYELGKQEEQARHDIPAPEGE